jgi:hypothetical protein
VCICRTRCHARIAHQSTALSTAATSVRQFRARLVAFKPVCPRPDLTPIRREVSFSSAFLLFAVVGAFEFFASFCAADTEATQEFRILCSTAGCSLRGDQNPNQRKARVLAAPTWVCLTKPQLEWLLSGEGLRAAAGKQRTRLDLPATLQSRRENCQGRPRLCRITRPR